MREMYNLYQLATEAINNLNSIGIYPHLTASDFKVNTRAKSRYGQASRRTINGEYVYGVNISSFLLDKRNDKNSVMTTIYHECLHCCDGCMCHTGKWKEYAEIVNKRFGTQIQRCTSRNEKLCAEVINEERVKKESNLKEYKWKCSACGKTFTKVGYRAPKWYMHPKGYTHKSCPCGRGKGYVMSEYYGYKLI